MAEAREQAARPAPRTIRGRLSLVLLAGNLAVVAVMVVTTFALASLFAREVEDDAAAARLSNFTSYLSTRVEALDVQVLNYTEWDDFYAFTSLDDPPPERWLADEVAGWLPTRTKAETILWIDSTGRVVYSRGDPADVDALASLALGLEGGTLKGPVALSRGPAIASVRPVTGWPRKPVRGYMAVAQSLSPELLQGFLSTTLTKDVAATAAGTRAITRSDTAAQGWGGIEVGSDAGELVVTAELLGPGGAVAGLVTVRDEDPITGHTSAALVLASLLAIGLTLTGGAGLNVLLRLIVSRPVEDMGVRVRQAGDAALSGAGYTPLTAEPNTPEELRTMLEVVDALLQRLAARQAELESAAEEARSAGERLRVAVDDSTEAMLLVVDGVVRLANPAAAALSGRPVGELLGAPISEVLGIVSTTTEQGETFDLERTLMAADEDLPLLRLEVQDRDPRWVEARVVAHPEQGEYLLTARDVTEQRRLRELREEVLELVGHDLKSPLSVIVGYLDILETRDDEATRAKAIEGARKGTERVNALLEDLVNTTRADELFAPQSMAPVRVDRLAEDVVASLEHTTRHPLKLECRAPCVVRGDEGRLRQALVNLVTNAIKYSPGRRPVTVGVRSEGPRVLLFVEDEGPGVPEDDRQRVFERFYRSDASLGSPGVGLGLYIVRAIVAAQGGIVRIEDPDNGTGSRFVIDLPAGHVPGRDGD